MYKLLLPFNKNLPYFILGIILGSSISLLTFPGYIYYQIYILIANITCSYFFTFIIGLLKGRWQTIYKWTISIIYIFIFIIEFFCLFLFGIGVTPDLVEIIMSTNMSEADEFLDTFWGLKPALEIIGLLICICATFLITQYIGTLNSKWIKFRSGIIINISFLIVILCALIMSIRNYTVSQSYIPPSKIAMFFNRPKLPDLTDFITNPEITRLAETKPKNIIIIFGESFAKKQSNIYGYEKVTNPKLNQLVKDSCLIAYTNVESYELTTVASFKNIMSTYRGDKTDYWRHPNIVEILQTIGYKTFWISNQNKDGLHDLLITRYAQLCDTMSFTHIYGSFMNEIGKVTYDETVLPILSDHITDSASYKCFFIHLVGSHYNFKMRYPSEYARFSPSDYKNKTPLQAQLLSEYDNSVLYNDYVVSEIFSKFSNDETLAIYVPDHGLDIFDSSPTYCKHGNPNNEVSKYAGKQIPFFIYYSKEYKSKNPEKILKFTEALNQEWSTSDLPYTIMDILDYKFSRDNTVQELSLFRDSKTIYHKP